MGRGLKFINRLCKARRTSARDLAVADGTPGTVSSWAPRQEPRQPGIAWTGMPLRPGDEFE